MDTKVGKVNKVKLITPFIVLTAESFAVITMYIKEYDLYRMLWTLLIVFIIFYMIGDAVRYVYSIIRPRVIPEADDIAKLISKVDPSRLQLDEETLQQYLISDDEDEDTDDFTSNIDLPEELMNEIQKDEFQEEIQDDDMFMDEGQE